MLRQLVRPLRTAWQRDAAQARDLQWHATQPASGPAAAHPRTHVHMQHSRREGGQRRALSGEARSLSSRMGLHAAQASLRADQARLHQAA